MIIGLQVNRIVTATKTKILVSIVAKAYRASASAIIESYNLAIIITIGRGERTLDIDPILAFVSRSTNGIVCFKPILSITLEVEANRRFFINRGHVFHVKTLSNIASALECGITVITQNKVITVTRRDIVNTILTNNELFVLINYLVFIFAAEHNVTAATKRNRIVSALFFSNRAGDRSTIASSIRLVVGLVALLFAGCIVRAASITSSAVFLANECTCFIITEACHHIAFSIMIKHLTTVTEYHGAFALDFNFIVAKAAKYNQALLFHILVCCKDMVITFASINHKLVVGALEHRKASRHDLKLI